MIFVAGSTGAVGRAVCRIAAERKIPILPHMRPRNDRAGAGVFELSDRGALVAALQGCQTVLQLIGTVRARFASGDTYETSDVGTTRLLVDAAKAAGSVQHVVLLSSVGAGRPVGAYLKAKAAAEAVVTESGLPWTIFRPSSFVGEGHKAPPGMEAVTRLLGLAKLRPIRVDDLAGAILRVAEAKGPTGAILEGASLWAVVGA